jgi:asparagine synthase (glutamine-hydrolysing)
MIDFHDEPIQYSGVFYQFVLRKHMADAGCKAVLVGYGADEIFSGYTHLAIPFLAALAAHGRWRDCARFISGASAFLESRLGIVREALRFARGYVKASLLERRKDGILHDIHRRLRARSGDVLLSVKDRWESEPSLPPMEFDLHELDQGRVFFDALLRCFRTNIALLVRLEDRNAMAHGLDLCMPFMDEDLVHAALCFPFHRYMEGGRNKAILRDAAAELLASEVMRYPKKLATPGSDQHLAFEVLRAELLDLLGSRLFCESGLWSRRCRELYEVDLARATRATTWFRVYMVHKWYERVVQSRG